MSKKIKEAFAKDGIKLCGKVSRFGDGFIAAGKTTSLQFNVSRVIDKEQTARDILAKNGKLKHVICVKGTHYEMGFLMGRKFPGQVEDTCTTYINHMVPQFISEPFDLSMGVAPLMYQTAYEILVSELSMYLVRNTAIEYRKALKNGHIPQRFDDELQGLCDGAKSVRTLTPVTKDRLIAANYGLDYMFMKVLTGQLVEDLRPRWENNDKLKKFLEPYTFKLPDMCNAFMVSGSATNSGSGSFLARDFQLNNGNVYNKNVTIVIRKPVGYHTHAAVCMPGMVGHVTFLNERGVAGGVNVVRSSAIDPEFIGMGSLFIMRELAERADSTKHAESVLRSSYMGVPWLFYTNDPSGNHRVFEVIARVHDSPTKLAAKKFVTRPEILRRLPSTKKLASWRPAKTGDGVWPRQGSYKHDGDSELYKYNEKLLGTNNHNGMLDPKRWKVGGSLFTSWKAESKTNVQLGNAYFAPWRSIPNTTVVNNTFLNPILRITQMSDAAAGVERMAVGNQWRYDTLVKYVNKEYGKIDFDKCGEIIRFLSPWKQPDYPQNAEHYAEAPDMFEAIKVLLGKSVQKRKKWTAKGNEREIIISGSLSVVDCVALRMSNMSGIWGSEPYEITLINYIY